MTAPAAGEVEGRAPLELDHVILAAPDLGELVTLLREATGVLAAPGGRHEGHGTHNALAHLAPPAEGAPDAYLELLARDPTQELGPFAASIAHVRAPTLHTWCLRGGDAGTITRRIEASGVTPRRLPMSRRRGDGSELAWEVVFAEGHPYGPLVPFFIDWRGAPHPAPGLPRGLTLERLAVHHRDASGLRRLLDDLGGVAEGVTVAPGAEPSIEATLRSDRGRWHLHGVPRA